MEKNFFKWYINQRQKVLYYIYNYLVFDTILFVSFDSVHPSLRFVKLALMSVIDLGHVCICHSNYLAIGSVPYYRGQFSKQQTFIVYGGKREELVPQELILSEMTEKQGFIISGAGFLVVGVDDVNYDGIADVLITDYQGWQGQRNAYLISSPKNMTFSPTIQPSSIPTRATTRRFDAPFRFNNNSSDGNSSSLLFQPSSSPTDLSLLNNNSVKPSLAPTSKAVFAIGTAVPTSGKPSLPPSLSPTSGYFHLRGFPPSIPPTLMPTINNTIEKTMNWIVRKLVIITETERVKQITSLVLPRLPEL
jgi:hypothetical protein